LEAPNYEALARPLSGTAKPRYQDNYWAATVWPVACPKPTGGFMVTAIDRGSRSAEGGL